jgi:hypothetical protein
MNNTWMVRSDDLQSTACVESPSDRRAQPGRRLASTLAPKNGDLSSGAARLGRLALPNVAGSLEQFRITVVPPTERRSPDQARIALALPTERGRQGRLASTLARRNGDLSSGAARQGRLALPTERARQGWLVRSLAPAAAAGSAGQRTRTLGRRRLGSCLCSSSGMINQVLSGLR